MESKFIEPANGECIGRWHSIADKTLYLSYIIIHFLPLPSLLGIGSIDFIEVMLYYIILLVVSLLFIRGYIFRLEASRRLFVSERGLVLNNTLNKYEIIEISNIYLYRNIIKFKCMYKTPRLGLGDRFNIRESEFEYKIEKRFREKPHELLEYLNNLCDQKMNKLKE